jgi:hypothetical protein
MTKMGCKTGEELGKEGNKGIAEPVVAVKRRRGFGLGF